MVIRFSSVARWSPRRISVYAWETVVDVWHHVRRGWNWISWHRAEFLIVLASLAFFVPFGFSIAGEDVCTDGVWCGLGENAVVTFAAVVWGYWLLFGWKRRVVLREYMTRAVDHPEGLLEDAPHEFTASQEVRDREVAALCEDLVAATHGRSAGERGAGGPRSSGRVFLVVAELGAGKTTFLVSLTRSLARARCIPLPVSLRGLEAIDFLDLARRKFVEQVDPRLDTEGAGDAIWRKVLASGRAVVLADGLDEIAAGLGARELNELLRPGLHVIADYGIPLVMTTRPSHVPVGITAVRHDLRHIGQEDAQTYVVRRKQQIGGAQRTGGYAVSDAERRAITTLSESLSEVGATPFYLDRIAELALIGRLGEPPRRRAELQIKLLDRYLAAIRAGELPLPRASFPDLNPVRRANACDILELVAVRMLDEERAELAVRDIPSLAKGRFTEGGVSKAIADALALSLLYSARGEVQFRHNILLAYFASLFYARHPGRWFETLARAPESDQVRLAGFMLAVAGRYPGRARPGAMKARGSDRVRQLIDDYGARLESVRYRNLPSRVGEEMLEREVEATGGLRATLLASAAGVVGAARATGLEPALARRVGALREECSRDGKLEMIPALARLGPSRAAPALWDFALDDDVIVGFAAAHALCRLGPRALPPLERRLSELLDTQMTLAATGRLEIGNVRFGPAAWVLPSMRGPLDDDGPRGADVLLDRVIELCRVTTPLVGEMSLARGFKLSAVHQSAGRDLLAERLLRDRPGFWYSRLTLLQTVAIRSLGDASRHRGLARLLRRHAEASDEHPFVRRYAELLRQALHDAGWTQPLDWTRYVWRTEQDAVATDWEVSVVGSLAADAILLSNLIYEGCAPEDFFGQRGFDIAAENSLPYCLSKSVDRRELLRGTCPSECAFGLCPYPISAQRPRAIFTESFCRAQRRQALKEGEPPWVGSGGWRRLRRRRFARFWSEMEQRVATEPHRRTTL